MLEQRRVQRTQGVERIGVAVIGGERCTHDIRTDGGYEFFCRRVIEHLVIEIRFARFEMQLGHAFAAFGEFFFGKTNRHAAGPFVAAVYAGFFLQFRRERGPVFG